MFNQFSHIPTMIAVLAALAIYGTSNAEHLPQVFFVHNPLPVSETIADDATSSASSEKYVVAVQPPEPSEETVAVSSSSEPTELHGAAEESSSSSSSIQSQSIRRRLWDAINNDNLDPDDVDANELLHSSSSSSSVQQQTQSSSSSSQQQAQTSQSSSLHEAAESFDYTAYVQIDSDDLSTALDNLEAASGNGPKRIDGFIVMMTFAINDPEYNEKFTVMETEVNRARSMGYTVIPGFDWEPGKEISTSVGSWNWKRYQSWGDPTSYTLRINTYLDRLADMRSGDNRIAIDFSAEDLINIEGSNPPAVYPSRSTEISAYVEAMKQSLISWANAENVDFMLSPGGPNYAVVFFPSLFRSVTALDSEMEQLTVAYNGNQSTYNALRDALSLNKSAASIAGMSYTPQITVEALRDNNAGFRSALTGSLGIQTFVATITSADGSISNMFTDDWFVQ